MHRKKMSLIATSSIALSSINTFRTFDCYRVAIPPSVSTNVLNSSAKERPRRATGEREKDEKKLRRERKREKRRRTYGSADIAKDGEDTSSGPAQRGSGKGEEKEEYTDAPGAVTSLLH